MRKCPFIIIYCLLSIAGAKVLVAQRSRPMKGAFKEIISKSGFVHPGMLQSIEDLERIRMMVQQEREPWISAWQVYKDNKWLGASYQPSALDTVGRGVGSHGQNNIQNDATAAYYNAIAWYITENPVYAKKTIEILNAWSYQLKWINGKDAVLCAGIYGYKFANAAEIIRYTYTGWSSKDIDQCKKMLIDIFYPVIKDFAPFANGNWDAACIPTMMSIGIFCDNRLLFNRAVTYYFSGWGDGALGHYVIDETGEIQESGRDQGHTQGGIGQLITAAQIGATQGLDMFGALDNRLLKGFEYVAQYNLGYTVAFVPSVDRTGKYNHATISEISRGHFSPVYEMAYNYYHIRKGLPAPFVSEVVFKTRPEPFSIDHPGAGTLLFALDSNKKNNVYPPAISVLWEHPVSVAGLTVRNTEKGISVQWVGTLENNGYQVRRSEKPTGSYEIIANDLSGTSYLDNQVKSGILYYYKVVAQQEPTGKIKEMRWRANADASAPIAGIYRDLRNPWKQTNFGVAVEKNRTDFDGQTYTIEASGKGLGQKENSFHYLYQPLHGDGSITARIVPQFTSQFSQAGLMIREDMTASAAQTSLILCPKSSEDIELPNWYFDFICRKRDSPLADRIVQYTDLQPPNILWGRFMEPYWVRLVRKGKLITAFWSTNGINWNKIGETSMVLGKEAYLGLVASSGLGNVASVFHFDQVKITNTKR